MKECKIQLKDGTKEAELNIAYKPENELIIVDGIFKFFGIDIDYEEIARKQIAITRLYENFYGKEENYLTASGSTEYTETGEPDFEETKKKIADQPEVGTDSPTIEESDNPGIRIKKDKPHYRCRYQCPQCKNTGNHYIPKDAKIISCHNCGNRMTAHRVNADFGHDEDFNYFVAGLKWSITSFLD